MKRSLFMGAFVGVLAVLACDNDVEYYDSVQEFERDEDVEYLLSKTSVNLPDNVSVSDLGMSVDERVQFLVSAKSSMLSRAVNPLEDAMTQNELEGILQEKVNSLDIPELVSPSEADIGMINEVFPDLTEEEILENLYAIGKVYQDMVSAVAVNDILCSAGGDLQARSVGYKDGAFYADDDKVTWYEIAAVLKHPFSAVGLIKQRNIAYDLTKSYYGNEYRSVDNKADAFRHSIWNVVMAKEGWGLKKEKLSWAEDFSTAHEKGTKYDGVASEMDLHNNKVGRCFYDAKASKKYTKILWWKIETGVKEPSYDEFCKIIYEKSRNAVFIDEGT
ncbi:MAG: hypothetical protein K2K67_07065 [Treponemataceae bacterium]|nr:hypothetical protein [Treponemataceae bacterium]